MDKRVGIYGTSRADMNGYTVQLDSGETLKLKPPANVRAEGAGGGGGAGKGKKGKGKKGRGGRK